MEINGVVFTQICPISPQKDVNGDILEDYPAERYNNVKGLSLNEYGQGPFC